MYSGQDTLAGGFPHSDIRGSTIARISPRLFAACHVLHRLLAPRHPPNALIALNTPPTPVRRTKPHIQASAAEPKCPAILTLNPTNQSDSPVKQHASSPSPHRNLRPASHLVMQRKAARVTARPQPSDNQPHMETVGIEPTTPCLQSRCSPTELRPRKPLPGRAAGQAPPKHRGRHPILSIPPPQARVWAREDLNLRPHAYQACALTN